MLCRDLSIIRACLIGLLAVAAAAGPVRAWETAHGPADNTGFVDVVTAPAQYAAKTIDNIGTFASGAGPVVAPDGTVYLANQEGKLMSFKPDGTPGWSRTIAAGQRIVSSPAIGSDGTIYVLSVAVSTDHRVNPPVTRVDSTLHRFNHGGAYLGQTPLPDHNGAGGTTAPPNLWRYNGTDLVIVPAVYRRQVGGGFDVRLLAFSQTGALVVDQRATSIVPEAYGGIDLPAWAEAWCFVPPHGAFLCYLMAESDFPGPPGGEDYPQPPAFPGVGIYTNPLGGTPFILLSDNFQDLVGFVLSGGAFQEVFRTHDANRFMRSAPAILPDKHAIIGTEDLKRGDIGDPKGAGSGGAVFSGPNLNGLAPVTGLQAVFATPTRLADGRTVLVGRGGQMAVLSGRNVDQTLSLADSSWTSPAASHTHLFVSTRSAFQTFDASMLAEVAHVGWSGGGESPPAIGPTGYVYAIAGNTLYVFPPGKQLPASGIDPQTGTVVVSIDPDATTQDSKTYKPPLTTGGNRLFACEKLDGDDCGKGDYQTIATAFCRKEGFVGAGHIEVDSRKVKAETLDGQFCSKKKCKVFDQIICANN
jgi:hypothetical protein